MAARCDFFFRQKVSEAELDLAFELLEQADRNLAADVNIYGVVSGAVPSPHSPVAELSVDLTAPGRAYDNLGQRIFFGTGQTVSCAADLVGIPTDVATAGHERWLGVFLRFRRLLSDPRTDGNSQQVYFRRDESFELVVRQAAVGPSGSASRVALQADELLVCDVLRRPGQTQIIASDIDTTRRQVFVFAQGTAVGVQTGLWSILQPTSGTVQAAMDEVDSELAQHFGGTGRRHAASAITSTARGFVSATNIQAAIDELVDDLSSAAAGSAGALRVGADAVAGTPNALAAGSVDGQLASLLGFINSHVGSVTGAHAASAISALSFGTVSATNVQAQLQEIVSDLSRTASGPCGADLVGLEQVSGSTFSIGPTSVKGGFIGVVTAIEAHTQDATGAHAATAISVADSGGNLNATNVEAALAEIIDAFEDEHYRGNETNAGMHRAIYQPNFGGVRTLLWDAEGNGGVSTHLRVYADLSSIWFTLNAAWNGSAWARDTTAGYAGGFRFSRNEFEIFHDNSMAATFSTWSRTWRLPISSAINSGWETTGSIQETGRLGFGESNTYNASRTVYLGGSVTFRSRFPAAPSSVTLSRTQSSTGWVGTPTVTATDRDGFAFYSSQTIAGGASAYWYGTYTAVA